MTHEQICERARRWLAGTRRCDPVFSNVASCSEIPDAIGWCSSWKYHGSIVVEAKTSLADFHADKWKYIAFKHPEFEHLYPATYRGGVRQFEKDGYLRVDLPSMGDFRYFMCLAGLISADAVERIRPDHGLLWISGRAVKVMREAPRRDEKMVDLRSEIRFLRFAIINNKKPYEEIDPQIDLALTAYGE